MGFGDLSLSTLYILILYVIYSGHQAFIRWIISLEKKKELSHSGDSFCVDILASYHLPPFVFISSALEILYKINNTQNNYPVPIGQPCQHTYEQPYIDSAGHVIHACNNMKEGERRCPESERKIGEMFQRIPREEREAGNYELYCNIKNIKTFKCY